MISGIFWGPSEAVVIAFTSVNLSGKIARKSSQIVKHWVLCVSELWQYSRTIPTSPKPNTHRVWLAHVVKLAAHRVLATPHKIIELFRQRRRKILKVPHAWALEMGSSTFPVELPSPVSHLLPVWWCLLAPLWSVINECSTVHCETCSGRREPGTSSLHSSFEMSNCPQSPRAPFKRISN